MTQIQTDQGQTHYRHRLAEYMARYAFWPLLWSTVLTLILLLGPLLPNWKLFPAPTNYLPLHTMLEFVAMAVSTMVFALGWNMRGQAVNSRAVLLGTAALCVAMIDFAHTFSFKGMPDFITPSDPEKAINFWLAGRFIAALSLVVVAYRPARHWSALQCRAALAGSIGFAALVWWIGLYHSELLPHTFITGQGLTRFKVLSEYSLTALYVCAAVGMVRQIRQQPQEDMAWLATAAWVLGLTELFFTLYQDVTDLFNVLGHVYKALAYIMIYRAVFVAGVTAPYTQLRESEKRLSNAMAASGEGLWDWDIERNLVSHNARWHQFLGLDDRSHTVEVFSEIIHEADRPAVMARIQACLNGERSYYSEHRMRHADGHYLWVMDTGDVVERAPDGRPMRMAGSVRDITELHAARLALENYRDHLEDLVEERTRELKAARSEAERLARVKSDFLANMSHEIRTPMNAILGMAHLIRRDGITPQQAEKLDKIDAASGHLLAIINNVLDLSKIEADKFLLEERDIDLDELLANIVSILAPSTGAKGLHLVIDNERLPYALRGDPTRLMQALLNLANNAVKFTESGTITIRTRVQDQTETDVHLRFEVEDTGIGIDENLLTRLFAPFEQADMTTTREYGGTGLGLFITKCLAQLMDGEAGVSSKRGEGSCFWITVRLKKNGPRQVKPALQDITEESLLAELSRIGHGQRILIVEDEPINQEITLEFLAGTGLTLEVANNGQEAVDMARTRDYDLILMDMQMPKMDGLEATRQIRQIPGKAKMPIVAMTANAFAQDRERCLTAGMQDFIAKPVLPAHLYGTVLKWLT